jgi:hypothetical protein
MGAEFANVAVWGKGKLFHELRALVSSELKEIPISVAAFDWEIRLKDRQVKSGLFDGMRTFGHAELCIDGGTHTSGRYFSIGLGSLLESFIGCMSIRGEGQNAGRG